MTSKFTRPCIVVLGRFVAQQPLLRRTTKGLRNKGPSARPMPSGSAAVTFLTRRELKIA
jgi:hypothetical protein